MKYKFTLELDLGQSNVYLTDRNDQPLDTEIETNGNVTTIVTYIEIPNMIRVHINHNPDCPVELLGASLGHIKFQKSKLEKLFVYHHPYGQNKNTIWQFGGLAEFEFFEHSAIKYHLIVGTTI